MDKLDRILYYLGWPWGARMDVKLDDGLCDEYPALLIRGQGACLVALAWELEDALKETGKWLFADATGADLLDFLFGQQAPAAIEKADLMIPGEEGLRLVDPGEVRFDIARVESEAFAQTLPERDWARGGVAPYARVCGVYEGDRLAALCGGRLHSGVLDLTLITHPALRGRGLGRRALSAMIGAYPGALPLWRTERENRSSTAFARKVGFEPFLLQEGIYLKEEIE